MSRRAPAHRHMKGHREGTCNEEQQVTTGLQICTCQVEVDTCDSYILLSTCLGQNQICSQQPGSQGSKASAFSMETLRCTPRRSTRQQEGGFFKPCQRLAGGVRHGDTWHPWCSALLSHADLTTQVSAACRKASKPVCVPS